MLSLQVCLRRFTISSLVLFSFIGWSCGFQVSPAFQKRKNHQLPAELKVGSFHRSSTFESLSVTERNHAFCTLHLALRNSRPYSFPALKLHRQPTSDTAVFKSRKSLLFRPADDFRLNAASDHDEDTSITSKIRSYISRIYKRLASPVKRLIQWIRGKFNKVDDFLEETIEEQEKAVEKAIADIEAKANALAADTTEAKMVNQTESTAQQAPKAVADEKPAITKTDDIQTEIVEPTETAQSMDAATTETDDIQTEIIEPTEAVQSMDAALASEKSMLAALDTPTTTAAPPPPAEKAPLSGKAKIEAQEQQATAEAQTEIVEKVEDVQTMDAALATEEGMFAQLDKPEAADADIMSGMQPSEEQKTRPTSREKPVGDRWAIAAPNVNLSGDWSLIITEDFKKKYDEYLKNLGQPFIVRSVALTLIGVTTEHTEQKEEGRTLFIKGTNARGIWERTLVTSGADKMNDQYTPLHVPVETADDERVEAEAWWEDNGAVHVSWMRNIGKYGGGDFESKRYLEDDGKVLVTESIFHPNDKDRKDVAITWRFRKTS